MYLVLANNILWVGAMPLSTVVSRTIIAHAVVGFGFGGESIRAFSALISRFFLSSSDMAFFALGFFATGFLTGVFFSGFLAGFFAGFLTAVFLIVGFAVAFLVVLTFVVMVAVAKDLAN